MIAVIGLGNPGKEYTNTRHNIGFAVVNQLQNKLNLDWRSNELFGLEVAEGGSVKLIKPLLYMNKSGEPIMKYFKKDEIAPGELWVVHDDSEVPFGEVRIKFGGTSAGHRGIEDLDEKRWGRDYWRIRIGVGRPENRQHDLADYVLSNFTPEEEKVLPTVIDRVTDLLVQSLQDKQLTAQTFNAKDN